MREAVILAGGQVTSLSETVHVPTALLQVGGQTLIDHLAWNLRRHGIERIVVAADPFAERLVEHVGDGSAWGVSAEVVVGSEALGTGGAAVLAAERLSTDEFLLLFGDRLFDVNYLDLCVRRKAADVPVAVAQRMTDSGPLDGGVYALHRAALEGAPDGAFSFERDLLSLLVEECRALGVPYAGAFIDVGEVADLGEVSASMAAWRDKPMVLLDRDGVLNEDRGWVHSSAEFAWLPGAVEGVKWINDRGCLAVVVTNQSGIARGLYSEDEYRGFEGWIAEQLAERGAHLDAVYHCPHHPTAGTTELTRECDCRKPAPGLVVKALAEFGVRPERAVFVGDKDSDMLAAEQAGVRAQRYTGQDLTSLLRQVSAC
jgi:D-glycero-D-manno-heptose 1,7-bisphosphate phosphatase